MTFETMLKTAKSTLAKETPAPNLKMPPQVTVLLTDHGNIYVTLYHDVCSNDCGDVVDNLLAKLKAKGETRILKMVTMWKDGTIDLSSMDFRKSIYEMDKENLETEVMLSVKQHYELPPEYIVKKLKSVIG